MDEDRLLKTVPRQLRHYLTAVAISSHHKYGSRYRLPVPREWRLCRLCRGSVEDKVHALFGCVTEARLVDHRTIFLAALAGLDPATHSLYGSVPDYDFLIALISSRKAVAILAKFVHAILQTFQEFPAYFPVAFRSPV
ncbi:hypothetical protein K438DRAFT_1864286 [Mycena galopus ATCC 62051]|nr:hypothetical protein K438DRAFT_1864286 [Mycena galopus ATCC 62051]